MNRILTAGDIINFVLLGLIPFGDEIKVNGRIDDKDLEALKWLMAKAKSNILKNEIKMMGFIFKELGFNDKLKVTGRVNNGLRKAAKNFRVWAESNNLVVEAV